MKNNSTTVDNLLKTDGVIDVAFLLVIAIVVISSCGRTYNSDIQVSTLEVATKDSSSMWRSPNARRTLKKNERAKKAKRLQQRKRRVVQAKRRPPRPGWQADDGDGWEEPDEDDDWEELWGPAEPDDLGPCQTGLRGHGGGGGGGQPEPRVRRASSPGGGADESTTGKSPLNTEGA